MHTSKNSVALSSGLGDATTGVNTLQSILVAVRTEKKGNAKWTEGKRISKDGVITCLPAPKSALLKLLPNRGNSAPDATTQYDAHSRHDRAAGCP